MDLLVFAQIGKVFDAIAPSLAAIATIVLAIFTWRLWWSTNKLWEEARDASKQTRALFMSEQRPWIAVTVEVAGALTWKDGRALLPLKFVLRNVGRSPALEVRVRHKMIPGTAAGAPFPAAEAMQLDVARELNNDKSVLVSTTVFPRADPPTFSSTAFIAPEDVETLRPYWQGKVPQGREFASFCILAGCVDYRLALDNERHQTGFIRWIYRRGYHEGGGHLVIGDPVQASELTIENWFSEGRTD